ncbi:CynX/NimT family MFS transporter [Brevibacterium spongiae]|uniref:MFS transporter n=1 Tax=Brevibacterium spongiae TaxID=2909672 RepID=A0ABY5SR84_9MICO|nr:MFS transporter [Brevibacterium spongiae]UVI37067.1 MFS transporter [Brevibacterium spongiae]
MTTSTELGFRRTRGLDILALACLVLIAASLRPAASSLGPVLSEVKDGFSLAEWQTGLLTALPGLVFAICGIIAVPLLKRLGLFTALALSCVAIVAGVGLRAVVTEWTTFGLLTILALAGMSIGNVILPVYVKARFPHRPTLGSTTFTVSLGLGSMLPSLLTAPLADSFGGWRVGLGFWLLLPLSALITWAVLRTLKSVPILSGRGTSGPVTSGPGTEPGAQRVEEPPRRPVFFSPKARYMAMFFGLQSANAYVQFGWVPQIYRDAGLDPFLAGIMLTIVTFGGLPGGFLAPQIIVRNIAPRAFLVSFGVSAVAGYTGLLLIPATTPWIWAILLGYGGFAFPAALALITSRTRDVSVTASTSAFVQSSGYVLAAIGPLALGGLLGLSGGWQVPLWFMVGISALMAVTGWLSAGPGTVDDELAPDRPHGGTGEAGTRETDRGTEEADSGTGEAT